MARPAAHAIIDQMLAIMRLVNELSPADPTRAGVPISLDDMADKLGMKPAAVKRGIELLNICSESMPGYFVDYDDERNEVTPLRMDMAIDRTIGLTPHEAMALLTALDAMGFDRDDPLAKALGHALPPLTRERISGVQTQAAIAGTSDILGMLSQAIVEHLVVRLAYRSLTDAEPYTREVEPHSLSYDLEETAWYLTAWCHKAQAWRTFRVDRIAEASLTEESFASPLDARGAQGPTPVSDFLDGAQLATLAVHDPACVGDASLEPWRGLRPADERIAEAWVSHLGAEAQDGAFIAMIPWIPDQPWLARMVVSTLGGVEALDPPELRTQVSSLAQDLLGQLG